MSVIDIQTRKTIDEQVADSMEAEAIMTADLLNERRRIARKLLTGELVESKYRLGFPMSVDVSARHCVLCGGVFPNAGIIYGFWVGGDFQYCHRGCRSECEWWAK